MSYRGIIFDFDGTLMDTQTPVHARAEAHVLSTYGIMVDPEEISQRFAGIPTVEVFRTLAPKQNPEQLVIEKWEQVKKIISTQKITPIEGMYELLELFFAMQKPFTIATASPRWYIDAMMSHSIDPTGHEQGILNKYFVGHYVSADDVARPKPAPDVFLRAAELIHTDPADCLVIGDGHSDVLGGLAAGMNVFHLSKVALPNLPVDRVATFSNGRLLYEHIHDSVINSTPWKSL